MLKVLLVEDEELIACMVKINLQSEGFAVCRLSDAESMLVELKTNRYDIIVLDILLPGRSGVEGLRRLRDMGVQTPVLMLTARSEIESKVACLELGSDDYLTKPFDMAELIARVKALVRRSHAAREAPAARWIKINRYEVDLEERRAQTNLGEMTLSEKEAGLLALLVRHAGRTVRRADILEEVWGMDVNPTERTVDNFVLRLRKLFEENPEEPKRFLTVRAIGYRFQP